jgi:hypothetical protein
VKPSLPEHIEQNHRPEAAAPKEDVAEVLESLIGEASRRAARPVTQDVKSDRRPFDAELNRALQSTMRDTSDKETGNANASSNAAGLVAMARMRANLKKNTGRSQVFEA